MHLPVAGCPQELPVSRQANGLQDVGMPGQRIQATRLAGFVDEAVGPHCQGQQWGVRCEAGIAVTIVSVHFQQSGLRQQIVNPKMVIRIRIGGILHDELLLRRKPGLLIERLVQRNNGV